jgi:Asp-tRNA(Asn)/Glu-tRNA(Gln) amidotransferase A subunit family amidase
MAIGAPERAGVVPPVDATAVARVKAAGGILLGTTNWGRGRRRRSDAWSLKREPLDAQAT